MPPKLVDSSKRVLPERIGVVGNTGSGKSTLAAQLADLLNCPHVELDALHWEPNWTSAPDDIFRARVQEATSGQRWVIDGNYGRVRDVYQERLQMLVWLDYPLAVNFWRLTRRNLQRIRSSEDLWETGNRETWQSQFLSRDSLYLWAIKTHVIKKRRYLAFMHDPEFSHVTVVQLRSPRATRRWLADVCVDE